MPELKKEKKTAKIKTVSIVSGVREFPDIDCDFFDRSLILEYLTKKYGQNHVASVGTITKYSAKNTIQDIGQVFEITPSETTAVTKVYNNELSPEENEANVQTVKTYFSNYPFVKELVPKFIDTIRGFGIHAGGIVITDKKYPITKHFALQRTKEDSNVATFWAKEEIEKMGGIKMDILGVEVAGQIHAVKEMVGLNPYKVLPQDEEVYREMVSSVKHKNIFQFDTNLGKTAFLELMPMNINDLSASSGIIRVTGTDEGRKAYERFKNNINEYQSGNKDYWREELRNEIADFSNYKICEKILEETYGVLIYQEQLIKMVQFLSKRKRTFQDGNRVRKALDKKIFVKYGTIDKLQGNKEILKKWHTDIMEIFEENLLPFIGKDGWESHDPEIQDFLNFRLDENNYLPIPSKGILNWFIVSSAYLFSIIHSKAYSVMSYEQMYQKYYYPKEFWLCALNYGDKKKVNEYTLGAKNESGMIFLRPDINISQKDFVNEGEGIRYGLKSIASCDKACEDIVLEREQGGEFTSLQNFCERMWSFVSMKKNVWENLIYSGALFLNDEIDLKKVIDEVYEFVGQDFTDLLEKGDDYFAKKEFDVLNCNITFVHSMLAEAHLYPSIDSLEDGNQANCMLKVEKTQEKKSKNGNVYILITASCMNSGITSMIYCHDLDVKLKKGEIYILPIRKNNGFLGLQTKNKSRRR